ncbi:DUF3054 domain-containing protein [Polycladomyces subterraneus]|uniref:DUF3054 domain-containing protein n=1 Tax=Polycladomyces subterraneus TaxID=1016997 RepID=A0ABT8IRE5_9BACL|nr:DUF3054 domain-containing protein [Polycladomyces subterraneus]MDN4595376.1 DUF3054 domain-containing protein [Polycladomyces subterraneus]
MQRSASIISLIAGDLLVLVLFTVIGRISHSLPLAVGAILWTTFPFALAWLVIAPLMGLYRPDVQTRFLSVTWRVGLAVLVAAPLGSYLRGIFLGHHIIFIFYVVTTVTLLLMMWLWRWGFTWWRRQSR